PASLVEPTVPLEQLGSVHSDPAMSPSAPVPHPPEPPPFVDVPADPGGPKVDLIAADDMDETALHESEPQPNVAAPIENHGVKPQARQAKPSPRPAPRTPARRESPAPPVAQATPKPTAKERAPAQDDGSPESSGSTLDATKEATAPTAK